MHPLFAVIEAHLALAMTCAGLAVGLLVLAIRPWRGTGAERVLVLGSGRLARRVIAEMERRRDRFTILGVVLEEHSVGQAPAHPVLGPVEDLEGIIARTKPDRIVVALSQRRGRLPLEALLVSRVSGVKVEDGAMAYERLTRGLAIDALTPSALIFSGGFRHRPVEALLARAASLLFSAAILLATAPLFLLIAIAIRLDSKGRAFFTQERAGLGGKCFSLIKFRTMRTDGANGSEWVSDNTSRITRVGRVLRRFHLDELPQFINVLRGDMNLVGPRPHPVSNFDLFSARIPFYSLRTTVRPGITGWAQVCYGYANNLEEETEKMRYDLYYIKHRSMWIDLRILVRTAGIFVSGSSTEMRAASRNAATPAISRAHRVA